MNITSLFLHKRYNGIWYVMYTDNGRKGWKLTKSRRKKDTDECREIRHNSHHIVAVNQGC
jgi:uncharacterized protein (DUF2249 family)